MMQTFLDLLDDVGAVLKAIEDKRIVIVAPPIHHVGASTAAEVERMRVSHAALVATVMEAAKFKAAIEDDEATEQREDGHTYLAIPEQASPAEDFAKAKAAIDADGEKVGIS